MAAVSGEELNGYDKLGPLEQKQGESPVPMLEQVRKFVWDHWKQQRRGHVVFTVYTKEGEPTTEYLFVEPNESGTWHVRGRLESTYSDRRMVNDPKKQPDRHVTKTFEAARLVRVGRGESSYLALKDASGKVVDEF
jgi:hypothetical protein